MLDTALNHKAFALLDTGCDMSVIPAYLLSRLEIRDNPFPYQGENTVHRDWYYVRIVNCSNQ